MRWAGRAGVRLAEMEPELFRCPGTGVIYREVGEDKLVEARV